MSPRLFGRVGRPRRFRPTRRGSAATAGGILVGAMVLGVATSSVDGDVAAQGTTATTKPMAAVDILPGAKTTLLGFAPPAKKVAMTPLGMPQFGLTGDLPTGPLGIPGVVLQAYKLAADRIGSESPQCKLPWFLLAGIGRIESNHAENGAVDQSGNSLAPIQGPALDGTLPGNEVIKDGNGGHARAIGPMQFIPSTWAAWGADANGDGKADPNNIFDATYSAGRYLCAGITNIMLRPNEVAAILRYNHSMAYVENVIAWAAAYATGVMPTTPIPDPVEALPSSKKPPKPPKPPKPLPPPPLPGLLPPPPPGPDSTNTPPPPPTCIGALCLPPNLIPPQLLPPQRRPAPAPDRTPNAPSTTPKKPPPAPAPMVPLP